MLNTCKWGPVRLVSNSVQFKCFLIVIALSCGFPAPTLAQTTTPAQSTPPPLGKLVDVGGYRVHLYCTGEGTPTVVIVGAGFSFNWGLVQPEVAKFTKVCSYDHSGIGWSDDGPKDSCSLRVSEVHTALKNAGITGPYVLVGHSLGGLVARVYAGQYPDEVAGMVFVDHAFALLRTSLSVRSLSPGENPPTSPTSKALPIPSTGDVVRPIRKAMGIESDPNFSKLSARDRELHLWAMSQTRNQTALQTNMQTSQECTALADASLKEHIHPLGDTPLVDVSQDEFRAPEYDEFQAKLLSLSQNSKQIVAEKSGHFIIIDRPDVVVDAVRQVVQSVRDHAKL